MRHQEFLSGVATRAGLEHTDDARLGATAALAAISEHLPADDRDALAAALPTLLEHESGLDGGSGGTSAGAGPGGIIDGVVRRTGWAPERARYVLNAVAGQLAAEDEDLARRIRAVVPSDVDVSGGPALPPDAASEGPQGRPQPLGAEAVDRALSRLTEWSGDVTGIERTIALPSERIDLVLDRVHGAERELAHRVRIVERTPTSLTVRARTESLRVVTELDVALAERVDDAVAAVGAGG
jgi:pterin-4a-carbinolamine dehydratase